MLEVCYLNGTTQPITASTSTMNAMTPWRLVVAN
jgi:hypothetical protein